MGLDFDLLAEIRRKSDGKPVTHTKMLTGESPQFHPEQYEWHFKITNWW